MRKRALARGVAVSVLGLGTVQFGRQTAVKYRYASPRPTDTRIAELLATAKAVGVNLLDTAPAYGDSEARLGEAIAGERDNWVLCTKVGEEFDGRRSRHDFSAGEARRSVERSLCRLRTDCLDVALVHADGRPTSAIKAEGVFRALRRLQREGLVRAIGYSGKGVADGRAALPDSDVLMCTVNAHWREEVPLVAEAGVAGVGVLVKKPLASGFHPHRVVARTADLPGVTAVVVGTLNPEHLAAHAQSLEAARIGREPAR